VLRTPRRAGLLTGPERGARSGSKRGEGARDRLAVASGADWIR
jgi:hypothetical protein